MSLPGWYPDPTGDWETRFWDGQVWTPAVANGPYLAQSPVDLEVTVPAVEEVLWRGGHNQFSTRRLWVSNGPTAADNVEFPLWAVARVEVAARGDLESATGTVTAVIAYPGYTDRSHWVMRHVISAYPVGALLRMWANRNRRPYFAPRW